MFGKRYTVPAGGNVQIDTREFAKSDRTTSTDVLIVCETGECRIGDENADQVTDGALIVAGGGVFGMELTLEGDEPVYAHSTGAAATLQVSITRGGIR